MKYNFKTVRDSIYDVISPKNNILDKLFNSVLVAHIGSITTKNFGFTIDTLMRNIGSQLHEDDGYGNAIGTLANPEYNLWESTPWFIDDIDKASTSNYMGYISNTYGSTIDSFRNLSDDDRINLFNPQTIKLENNLVGTVRGYDYDKKYGDKATPNETSRDSRIGEISSFYLAKTLQNAYSYYKDHNGAYVDPTYGDYTLANEKPSITQGAYSFFNGEGPISIKKNAEPISKRVRLQSEITGQIIPWSTTDHQYGTSGNGAYKNAVVGNSNNLDTVMKMLGLDGKPSDHNLSENFNDITQRLNTNHLYHPFGNYYSMTYSLGLLTTSGKQTQEFIAKSMLGYPLLGDDEDINLQYTDGKIEDHYSKQMAKYGYGKKYYVNEGSKGTTYIGKITKEATDPIRFNNDTDLVRIKYKDPGNDNMWSLHGNFTYGEAEGNVKGSSFTKTEDYIGNKGVVNGSPMVFDYNSDIKTDDIINYTNLHFLENHYDTLISRFHSQEYENGVIGSRANRDTTQTAISQYGMSHGRNLLKHKHKGLKTNGYSNPYCRVWTNHHQYARYSDTIRPFDGDLMNNSVFMSYRTDQGQLNLKKFGSKTDMGLVKIAPTKGTVDDIRKCMFSIENLAWRNSYLGKDAYETLRNDEKGPQGGRIMWFPPYNLKFNERASVNWGETQFIGRGERIYTYTNTDRTGSLSFSILIDHPSILNSWRKGGSTISDVDDVDSEEQAILRFFAGCEMLDKDYDPRAKKKEESKKPKTPPMQPQATSPQNEGERLVFYVYYPNNYTGIDDTRKGGQGVNAAMGYLINGVDSGYNKNGSKIQYPLNDMSQGRGYEMASNMKRGNGTISSSNGLTVHTKYYNLGNAAEKRENRRIYGRNYKGLKLVSATYGGIDYGFQLEKNNKAHSQSPWAYRVDKRTQKEVMHVHNNNLSNYADYTNGGLNSTHYTDAIKVHSDAKKAHNEGCLYSFTEMYCAVTNDQKINDYLISVGDVTQERIDIIRDKLMNYDVRSLTVQGFASSHGTTPSNNKLNSDRATVISTWFIENFRGKGGANFEGKLNKEKDVIGTKLHHINNSAHDAKIWRCAKVIIELEPEKIIPKPQDGVHNINYHDNVMQMRLDSMDTEIKKNHITTMESLNAKVPNISDYMKEHAKYGIEDQRAFKDAKKAKDDSRVDMHKTNKLDGYGQEYEFFDELSRRDNLMRHKIVDKIKYFDPAFHSITPEGFEGRLSFLHQCTRQGPTSSQGEMNSNSRNLAFGAPPICVLRIGDFYNTKIIINAIDIDYNDASWDLNDEGIGVMPMLANITIGFTFLGGSSLEGPIARLQNAVSFNYYANSEVHESRTKLFEKQEGI